MNLSVVEKEEMLDFCRLSYIYIDDEGNNALHALEDQYVFHALVEKCVT